MICECVDCGQTAPDATDDGDELCADCLQNRSELAWERMHEAYNEGFYSLEQQQAEARKLK